MPKVSVVVPVYNTERYLDELFSSLQAQTMSDFEIIFVDDGSTDASLSRLREFEKRDGRVVVVTQENQGAATARNKGFERATGELISFIDSDDFVSESFLEDLARPFEDAEVGTVVCYIDDYFEEKDEFKLEARAVASSLPGDSRFSPAAIENLFNKIVGYTANKMFRSSLVRKYGLRFQAIPSHDDMAFVYTMLAVSPKMAIISRPLYHYRKRLDASSITDTTMAELYECGFLALEQLRSNLIKYGKWNDFALSYVNYAVHVCRWKLGIQPEPKKAEVREALRDTWLRRLDVLGYPRSWYLNDYEYDLMCDCLNWSHIESMRAKIEDLAREKSDLAKTNETLVRENRLQGEEIERIRSSKSFRIGHALTAAPRAVRKHLGKRD